MWRPHTFENVGSETEFGMLRLKEFQPSHVPNFEELGFLGWSLFYWV
jgi:hypothetical protein